MMIDLSSVLTNVGVNAWKGCLQGQTSGNKTNHVWKQRHDAGLHVAPGAHLLSTSAHSELAAELHLTCMWLTSLNFCVTRTDLQTSPLQHHMTSHFQASQ